MIRLAALAARVRVDIPLALLDCALVVSAFGAAAALRSLDHAVPSELWGRFASSLPLVVAVTLLMNWMWGLYGPIWRHASGIEARRVVLASISSAAVLSTVVLVGPRRLPLSVIGGGCLLYMVLAGAVRFHSRLFALRRRDDAPGTNVLVLGAGDSGAALVREMRRTTRGGLVPIAFLDDDPRTHGKSCHGVRILGSLDELPRMAQGHSVDQAVLAVADASAELVRRCADLAEEAGIPLRVLPGISELVQGRVGLEDLRDLRIEDLLGRQQVVTDMDAVHTLLRGRRVLITGAGGSIGSEIARQVADADPELLYVLDHDETHLHDVCAALSDHLAPDRTVQLLADLRDRDVVLRLFQRFRPEIVFHAAALKHVPVLEDYPGEAVRTNVFGTANLIEATIAARVERLVFISTDKAVNPSCVMGATKRLGELLIRTAESETTAFSAVRFGNVLGSRGSVVPTFLRQVNSGGPVTITHPSMTRFFMSIREAVQLVLQAATLGERSGEIYVLDMGQQVRIYDLAQRMIRLAGRRVGEDVEIRVTGVRRGEKLVEELHTCDEELQPTAHPSVRRLDAADCSIETLRNGLARLRAFVASGDDEDIRSELFRLIGTAVPSGASAASIVRPGGPALPPPRSRSSIPSPSASAYEAPTRNPATEIR